MRPKVSIITPLHNKGPYIGETIKSVLSQSFTDWEWIVVENGSTDNGPDIVRSVADARVRLVVSEKKGPSVARNLGISESCGEWIQFLDGDDLLLPGHLQAMWEATIANPHATLLSCDWLQGRQLDRETNEYKHPTNKKEGADYAASAIAYTPWVPHAAWVKRSILGEHPWWDEFFDTLLTSEDHVFWFKMLLAANAAYSPHLGVFYRVDAKDRRHNLSDFDRFLRVVDVSILANINLLKAAGRGLSYNHQRILMTCYLQQSIAKLHDADLIRQIMGRIKEFRPSFANAAKRGDLVVLATYMLPLRTVAKIQEWRRSRASAKDQELSKR
jgi:glycosyltransferase involved in cell wall biosynthesis